MRALVDELGLKPQMRRLKTGRGATLRDGKFVSGNYAGFRAIWKAKDLGFRSKLRLPLILNDLRRSRGMLDFYAIEKAAPIDDASAYDWALGRFGREVLDYVIEPPFASTFTVLPENLSRAFVLATINYMFAGFRLSSFHGGNGLLTQTLASKLRVRTGVEVSHSAVRRHRDRHARQRRDVDRRCRRIATPAITSRACDTLTPGERAFDAVRYAFTSSPSS
jgi:protoporphyrinogen oxidase